MRKENQFERILHDTTCKRHLHSHSSWRDFRDVWVRKSSWWYTSSYSIVKGFHIRISVNLISSIRVHTRNNDYWFNTMILLIGTKTLSTQSKHLSTRHANMNPRFLSQESLLFIFQANVGRYISNFYMNHLNIFGVWRLSQTLE